MVPEQEAPQTARCSNGGNGLYQPAIHTMEEVVVPTRVRAKREPHQAAWAS